MSPFLTVHEVAAELRVGADTVRRYITTGELPAHRVGREYRIARAQLADFLAGTRVQAKA